jgi:uncharacterized membrane protein AbrB (regulator of aidB expression)
VNSKIAAVDYLTILTGSMPGAMTQMIMLGEEIEGIDLTVVTFFHVIRLLMVVSFIPLLVFSPLFDTGKAAAFEGVFHSQLWQWDNLFPDAFMFLIAAVLCSVIGKKIKLPTPCLLGRLSGRRFLAFPGFRLMPCRHLF